jgi:hypothetical protein
MTDLAYVVKHANGDVCPEYSHPVQGACPLTGTGVHAGIKFVPSAVTSDEDILSHFLGPLDVEHLVLTGNKRRVVQVLPAVDASSKAALIHGWEFTSSPFLERLMGQTALLDEVDLLGPIDPREYPA